MLMPLCVGIVLVLVLVIVLEATVLETSLGKGERYQMLGHTIDFRFRFRFSAVSKTSAFGQPLVTNIR